MSKGSSSQPKRVNPAAALDVEQLAGFLAWLDKASQSNEDGRPLPQPPTFRDPTVTRWTEMIMGLATGAANVEARLRVAEGAVDRQASQLREQRLRVAEQLAALYERSNRANEALAIRLRAAGLSLRA